MTDHNTKQIYLKAAREALHRGEDRQTISIIFRNIIT